MTQKGINVRIGASRKLMIGPIENKPGKKV
jgi:hypothetical protein